MNDSGQRFFAGKAADALVVLVSNVGKMAANIGRLADALAEANAIAEKHHQWERREDG